MAVTCIGDAGPYKQLSDDSVPPGFASLKSFTLERVPNDCAMASSSSSSDSQSSWMRSACPGLNADMCKKSLEQKAWINYGGIDDSLEEASQPEMIVHEALVKGVLRGCGDCANCQKVNARWHPEDGHKPILDEAPVFHPDEEEFSDTLKYIASIKPIAEQHGICRIVPPSSWKPPCPLKEKVIWENHKFSTYVQPVHKLQNHCSVRHVSRHCRSPKRKKRTPLELGDWHLLDNEHLLTYDEIRKETFDERFGIESGPDFTLKDFQGYADYFKEHYFCAKGRSVDDNPDHNNIQGESKPSLESIEGEYWQIVEKPTEEIEVLFGFDIETNVFGSGFPKAPITGYDSEKYMESGWNLNNSARLPGSLLSFENADISGVIVPLLYVGMCFSSFCWHVEDHHLYSLNYMHWGAPKIWYGVPGRSALKYEAAIKKHLPGFFEKRSDLLHKLTTQLSPSTLRLEGVPVYRCVQHSGEFVVTFPRAYHSGFSCGFNCSEAVNVAPVDWLPYGQNAVEIYSDQRHKVSISHDKLLLEAANEAIRAQLNSLLPQKFPSVCLQWKDACGPDKILAKVFKSRIEVEHLRREFLWCSSQSRKMDAGFDSSTKRECFFCHFDLHISAVVCSCSSKKYACLNHVRQMCSCDWRSRVFLFRYDIDELNVLCDALSGMLRATYRWGIAHLGLSVGSYIKKDKSHGDNLKEKLKFNLSGLSTSTKQSCEMEIQRGEAQAESLVMTGPMNEEGIAAQTFHVVEGCSSSSSKSLSHANSQCSGQDGFDIRLEINSHRKHSTERYLPDVTQVNPSTNTNEAKKLFSVGDNHTSTLRRVSCNAEPLDLGVICPGKLWSNSQAIFPKGYRSRVKYFSILDPSQMCHYVSQILDAGPLGPLFMVQPEHASHEVFIHISATKCWDMVRERVNKEITRQHSFGNFDVPKLQPPSSIDGFKMFGFSSPEIIQSIEAIDKHHACSEYWESRYHNSTGDLGSSAREEHGSQDRSLPGSAALLQGLLMKANPEELQTLYAMLRSDKSTSRQEIIQLVRDEIGKRP